MKITLLDAKTLGEDLSLEPLKQIGECVVYQETDTKDIEERIKDTDVVIINKIKLNERNLKNVKNLKLIFGAKELSKMTFSQKVIFRKLPPNGFKKVNTNDKL